MIKKAFKALSEPFGGKLAFARKLHAESWPARPPKISGGTGMALEARHHSAKRTPQVMAHNRCNAVVAGSGRTHCVKILSQGLLEEQT